MLVRVRRTIGTPRNIMENRMYSFVVWKVLGWDTAINPKSPKKKTRGVINPIHAHRANPQYSKPLASQYKTKEATKHIAKGYQRSFQRPLKRAVNMSLCFRLASFTAASSAKAPQPSQNFAFIGSLLPHFKQYFSSNRIT